MSLAYNRATAPLLPDAAALRLGGCVAVFYARRSPVNSVKALGLDGPVPDADLERVEEFFRSRDSQVIIDLCPLADTGLVKSLTARGYGIVDFETITFRPISSSDRFDPATGQGFTVSEASPEEMDEAARVMAEGFTPERQPASPVLRALGRATAAVEGARLLMARVQGRPVATASMRTENGVAAFFGTVTLAPFRGRGIQSALIRERLRLARSAGCDVAKLDARPGTTSQRNAERAGFRVAYTRPQVVREWGSTTG